MESIFDDYDGFEKVKISKLHQRESQIRSEVSDKKVKEIADSIREQGLIEPLEVTEKQDSGFEVIVGSIRLLALKKIDGVSGIPVKKVDVSGMEKVERELASNTARKKMNTMDKIEAAGKLSNHLENSGDLENSDGRGPDGVKSLLAKKLGVSRNTITKWIRVYNEASDEQKKKLRKGEISLTVLNEELKDKPSGRIGGKKNIGEDESNGGSSKKRTASKIKSGITSIENAETDSLPDEDKDEIAERFENELWDTYCELRDRDKARRFFEEKINELDGDEYGYQ
ncbi:MAG: ParB/RepB/Spo0J family partition protein [Candidatus Nanohaloarchaea archaeon]